MVTRILRLDAPPKPADAADALALAISHIWRGGAQARIDAAVAAAARSEPDDRVRPRARSPPLTLTSAVLEVGGVGLELMCTPDTLATLRTGRSATLPTSMVVREDSLTLFGFADDDEKQIFELVQTAQRGRPQAGPGDARGPHARTPYAARSPATTSRPSPRCPASARRAPSGSSSSSRTGSAPRPSSGGTAAAVALREPWRDQVQPGLVGLGWSAKDADQADRVRRRPRPATQPDVAALLRAALRSLSKA